MRRGRPLVGSACCLLAVACGRIGYDSFDLSGGDPSGPGGGAGGDGGIHNPLAGAAGDRTGSGGEGAGTGADGGSNSDGGASSAGAPDAGGAGDDSGGAAGDGSGGAGGEAGASGGGASAGGAAGDGSGGAAGSPNGTPIVAVGNNETAMHGDTGAGTDYVDLCPPDEVVIGYDGWVGRGAQQWLQSVQTLCGHATIEWTGSQYEISVTPGTTLPLRGQPTGSTWQRHCPADQVVIGFDGRSSGYVDQLSFRCAPLSSSDGTSVTVGPITTLAPAGGNNGSVFQTTDCPSGEVANGSHFRADNFPRAFSMYCGVPTVQ